MSTALKAVLGVILGIVLIIGIWFGVTQFQRITADYRGETDQIENTEANAQFRMQAYDGFFDKCSAIQTAEDRIDALEAELETTSSDIRKEELNTAITANKANRNGLINEYNADAAKEWTVGQFKSQDLPYNINKEQENTTCVL